MRTFTAISNSTIYDVCLNTYGTLNQLAKLMEDNGFESVDNYPTAGQIFLYDENLINVQTNQSLSQNYTIEQGTTPLKYSTK